MRKTLSEFRDFFEKGNVIALAIGVMMGTAFNNVVNSLIADIFMPVISVLTSDVSFESWYIPLNGKQYDSLTAAKAADAPMIMVGNFLSSVFSFLVISLVLFFIMKVVSRAQKFAGIENKDTKSEEPTEEILLLREIRDLLKSNSDDVGTHK